MSYWFSNPAALFSSFNIIPFLDSDPNERYNSLTRLIILFTIIFAIINGDNYILVLSIGMFSLLASLVIYFITANDRIFRTVLEKQALNDHLKTIDYPKYNNFKISVTPGSIPPGNQINK
jgi:hypothetical protein